MMESRETLLEFLDALEWKCRVAAASVHGSAAAETFGISAVWSQRRQIVDLVVWSSHYGLLSSVGTHRRQCFMVECRLPERFRRIDRSVFQLPAREFARLCPEAESAVLGMLQTVWDEGMQITVDNHQLDAHGGSVNERLKRTLVDTPESLMVEYSVCGDRAWK